MTRKKGVPLANIAASVKARLLQRAHEDGEDFNSLLVRYVLERLLYRLGASKNADDFVLKGALLFVAWSARPHRATKDLDLLVSGDGDNLERVARALGAFGAPRHIVEAAGRMTPTEIVYLGAPPVRIDILRSADGIDTEETIARAGSIHVGTLVVPIISRGDLIANKKASGRAQDLADVAALERV